MGTADRHNDVGSKPGGVRPPGRSASPSDEGQSDIAFLPVAPSQPSFLSRLLRRADRRKGSATAAAEAPDPAISAEPDPCSEEPGRDENRPDTAAGAEPRIPPPAYEGPWRAWREPGPTFDTAVLHVEGECVLTQESAGCRVVLQEAVLSRPQQQGGASGGGAAASPILTLERVLVPPPYGFGDIPDVGETWTVTVTYRKDERFSAAPPLQPGGFWGAARARHTHVTILPDGITVPIRES